MGTKAATYSRRSRSPGSMQNCTLPVDIRARTDHPDKYRQSTSCRRKSMLHCAVGLLWSGMRDAFFSAWAHGSIYQPSARTYLLCSLTTNPVKERAVSQLQTAVHWSVIIQISNLLGADVAFARYAYSTDAGTLQERAEV